MKRNQIVMIGPILVLAVVIGYSTLVYAKQIDKFIPPGYEVAKSMRLTKKAHGVSGKLYLLADKRIKKIDDPLFVFKPLTLIHLNKKGKVVDRFTYEDSGRFSRFYSEDITGNGFPEIILVVDVVSMSGWGGPYLLLLTTKSKHLVEIPMLDDKGKVMRLTQHIHSGRAFVSALDYPGRKDIIYWECGSDPYEDGHFTSYWEFRFDGNSYRGRLLKKRKEFREADHSLTGREEFEKMLQGPPQFPERFFKKTLNV